MSIRTALVLGTTRGIGGEVARRLAARGWRVRAVHRAPRHGTDGFDWVKGDALSAAEVARDSRLRAALGEEPRTPLDEAVRATLIGLGCLSAPIGAAPQPTILSLEGGRLCRT